MSGDNVFFIAVTAYGFDYKAVAPINPVIFKDQLYLGAVATSVKGNPIWRSQDGISWEPVEADGFEKYIYNFSALFVYDGNLFANVFQVSDEVNLFFSPDGETWSQVKEASHGNDNSYAVDFNPAVEFKGDLYFGGNNDAGAQVWKLCTDCQ